MNKQDAVLKLATKWASTRVPDYLLGELHHRAADDAENLAQSYGL